MKRTKCQMSYAMSLIISYSHSINLEQLLNQWTHGSALGVFESGHSISSLGAVELCTLSCCCNSCWRANLEFITICSDLRSSSIFQERNTHQMTKLWIIYSIIKPVWFTDILCILTLHHELGEHCFTNKLRAHATWKPLFPNENL